MEGCIILMARGYEKEFHSKNERYYDGEVVYVHPKRRYLVIKTMGGYRKSFLWQDIAKIWRR